MELAAHLAMPLYLHWGSRHQETKVGKSGSSAKVEPVCSKSSTAHGTVPHVSAGVRSGFPLCHLLAVETF